MYRLTEGFYVVSSRHAVEPCLCCTFECQHDLAVDGKKSRLNVVP